MTRPLPGRVSVIVSAHNAADVIADQLASLTDQHPPAGVDWEVIVVDDASTDHTAEIAAGFAHTLPIRVEPRPERGGLNAARNTGAAAARGDLLCYLDADDLTTPGWLCAITSAARRGDLVGGALDHHTLNPPHIRGWRDHIAATELPVAWGQITYPVGANMAVWADVLTEIGGWDPRYRRGGNDLAIAAAAHRHHKRIVFAADAVVAYRHRSTLTGLARQSFGYGRGDALLRHDHPDLVPHRRRHLTRNALRLAQMATRAPFDPAARGQTIRLSAHALGLLTERATR